MLREPSVGFVISVSGSIRLPREQLKYEIENDIRSSGAPRWIAKLMAPITARKAMRRQPIWWEKNGAFDPVGDWQSLRLPILFVFGAGDRNVNVASNLARLHSSGIEAAKHVKIHVLEGLGHAMMDEQSTLR